MWRSINNICLFSFDQRTLIYFENQDYYIIVLPISYQFIIKLIEGMYIFNNNHLKKTRAFRKERRIEGRKRTSPCNVGEEMFCVFCITSQMWGPQHSTSSAFTKPICQIFSWDGTVLAHVNMTSRPRTTHQFIPEITENVGSIGIRGNLRKERE